MRSQKEFLYQTIANSLIQLMKDGTLKPGERLPSVRKLSKQQGVSVSSVLKAYQWLENNYFIESRPQSGYYVLYNPQNRFVEPESSTPPCEASYIQMDDIITTLLESVVSEKRNPQKVVPLGAATPGMALYPTTQLQRLFSSQLRHSGGTNLTYDYPPGNYEIRREIAKRSVRYGCQFSAEEIVMTNGAIEAINICLRAVAQPGDIIAIESPTYLGFLPAIESLGMMALEIPTHPRTGVDLDALAQAMKTHPIRACLFVPNFNNPLGSLMPDQQKKRLADLLKKHDVALIENDIYGDLYFGSHRPKPVKTFDLEHKEANSNILLCSSFSKSLAPGLRIGWIVPGKYRDRVKRLKFMMSLATPTLSQQVVAEFLRTGAYERHLATLRHAFSLQITQMTQAGHHYFPESTRMTRPQGGYLLWVQFPRSVDSQSLYVDTLAQNISITPGVICSAKPDFKHCIRLNCGNPWSPEIEQAIQILGEQVQKQLDS